MQTTPTPDLRVSAADAPRLITGANSDVLLVCDHASNAVPQGLHLGVPAHALNEHVAWDIGAEAMTRHAARLLDCRAWLASVSRLVVDCNRLPEAAIPLRSDGYEIPGNQNLGPAQQDQRMALHAAFHDGITLLREAAKPRLIASVHSFTPQLASAPAPRPWPIAVLWNTDERTARLAIQALESEDLPGPIGANEPYSGKSLNYTLDRHAEAHGIPALGFEVRQDLIADQAGAQHYGAIIARTIQRTLEAL